MVSVVTSSICNATGQGVPVTQLPTTGFTVTSVNLVGTANVSGQNRAVQILGVNLEALTSSALEARISNVSTIATTNSLLKTVPIVGFWAASVSSGEVINRVQPLENVVTQTGSGAASGVVSENPVSVPVTVRFLSGPVGSLSEFGTMVFDTSGNTATVNFSTSTVVSSGNIIEVRGSDTISDLIKDFSFTLRVRRDV